MTLRTAGAISMSAVALTAFSAAAPAAAAPDCGTAPVGGTLTVLNGTTCEVDFSAAGSYTWTLPTGVTGLQALLLGGGSGAISDSGAATGYAGNAGSLRYVDYSSASAGAPVTVVVGAGGATSASVSTFPDPGGDSEVTLSGAPSSADGGSEVPSLNCEPEGSSIDAGNGYGAGGGSGVTGVCETSYAPGLAPSIDALDSYGAPRPAVFWDLATLFGAGGRILITADTLPADASLDGLGIGANVRYDSGVDNFTDVNAAGGSGRVIFRYTIGAPAAPALAATGVETAGGLGIASGVVALGAALLVASRRQKRA